MKWQVIKSINDIPLYDWVILGRWIDDEEHMAWQIGRRIESDCLEFWGDACQGPYAFDSVYAFNPNESTHFIQIEDKLDEQRTQDLPNLQD